MPTWPLPKRHDPPDLWTVPPPIAFCVQPFLLGLLFLFLPRNPLLDVAPVRPVFELRDQPFYKRPWTWATVCQQRLNISESTVSNLKNHVDRVMFLLSVVGFRETPASVSLYDGVAKRPDTDED